MRKVFVVRVYDVIEENFQWNEVHTNRESLDEATYLITSDGDFKVEIEEVELNRCEIG